MCRNTKFHIGGFDMGSRRYSQPAWNTVKELFKDQTSTRFIIPVYQRNYVWEVKNQVKKLLDDFYELLNKEDNYTHFLGIIIDYNAGKKNRVEEYYVIDGQQRITTLFLLVAALRQRAKQENNQKAVTELDYWININFNQFEGNFNPKLVLLMGDREIFNKIILGKLDDLSDEDKESKLAKAYSYIYNFFTNTVRKTPIWQLIDTFDKFLLVEIPLDREDDAQQIFETINDRGSKLLATDLIRNYVLMCAGDDKMEQVFMNTWRPFESKFNDSKEMEMFFYYFLINQLKDSIKLSEVYDQFRIWLDDNRTARSIEEAIDYASSYADMYNFLYKTPLSSIKNEHLWKALKDFRNIKSDMPAPVMMEMTYLYKKGEIKEEQYIAILNLISSYLLRRAIIGMDTSGITKFFRLILRNIVALTDDEYTNIVDVVIYCLVDMNIGKATRMPNDEEIKKTLKELNVYDYPLALHCFFDKYENEKVTNPIETMNYQIEHIMPQEGEKWLQSVGLTLEEYGLIVNRLGNLTLTTKHDNPRMSNNLFDYKKIILKNTASFRLNTDVYSQSAWGPNEIEERNDVLIKEVLRLYPYQTSEYASKYDKTLIRARNLPNMNALIEWGIISIQDSIYLKRYKENSKAILVSSNQVNYNGKIIKISQWIAKLYGFKSINYYKEICVEGSDDTLDTLRNDYMSEHQELEHLGQKSKTVEQAIRNDLASRIKLYLNKKVKEGKIVLLSSANTYIRFAGVEMRKKVGLYGNGEWDKLEDLVAIEIHNTIYSGVSIYPMMGPGNDQSLREKWHNFAINTKVLGGRFKDMRKKWDMMSKSILLAKPMDTYEDKEKYYSETLNNLALYFEETLPEIERAFADAPDDFNDPIFAKSDLTQSNDDNYSLETYQTNSFTIQLYEKLDERIMNLSKGITKEFKKLYVAYKLERNFVDLAFQQKRIYISINMKFADVNDPKGICRDVTSIGHLCNGDCELYLSDLNQLDDVMYIIKQSHDSQINK